MKKKIGMVAVGQAPRTDIMPGMKRVLGADVQVIEKGALDGLSLDEIQSLYPKEGMTTMDRCVKDLYMQGTISYEDAVAHVRNAKAIMDVSR